MILFLYKEYKEECIIKKKITEKVSKDICEHLQRLDYTVVALKSLYFGALQEGLDKEKIKKIFEEYINALAEVDRAREKMWNEFKEKYPNSKWNLDYSSGELTIEYTDSGE